jgi:7-cyano-7-deazaguanine synthase
MTIGGIPVKERAVVLLSGGLDSTTCLALALRDGYEPWPLIFRYGQRHVAELQAAEAVAEFYRIPAARRHVVDLGRAIRGSALTGDGEVPLDRSEAEIGAGIPSTYVPARNLVFLALATSFAEAVGAGHIFIGVNALDYSGYPDCRPEFIAAFREAARLGTRAGIEGHPPEIHTPLVRLGKADIVRLAAELSAPLHLTHSCYLGTRPACGRCDACRLRIKGFREAGLRDPVPYAIPVGW